MPNPAPFEPLLTRLVDACHEAYGPRLVSVVVYGSVARGTARTDSDIDVLIVLEPATMPPTRLRDAFDPVRDAMKDALRQAEAEGVNTYVSPLIMTREGALRGNLVFLDMTDEARVLFDREGFFASVMDRWRRHIAALGARRVRLDDGWYWDLKPDYKPGDVFELLPS